MIKESPVSLIQFFSAVEHRLDKKFPGEWPSFQIDICGHVIELRFDNIEQVENAMRGLTGQITKGKKPDAIFKYWKDDCAKYISPEHTNARWNIQTNDGVLYYVTGFGLNGADWNKHVFYTCQEIGSKIDPLSYAHILPHLFYQWGRSEGLLMLHAASVGADGKGILIAGRGGAGKSTLAVSCLMTGMEFVSDDYTMITENHRLEAFPVYSSVCLNPDMYDVLQPHMPIRWQFNSGKLVLDASAFSFTPRLPIHALVLPEVTNGDVPEVREDSTNRAVIRIAYSSVSQMLGIRDIKLMQIILSRLKGLPTYEFRQCQDFQKNAECLREFIKKEL